MFDLPHLADWDGNGIAIQPNAAVATIAAGLGLVLLSLEYRRSAAAAGSMAGLLGAATLFQHVTGRSLGIDELLTFGRSWGGGLTVAPGRMGVPGSTSWTLAGAAMTLSAGGRRLRRYVPLLGIAIMGIAWLSLTGYLFGADTLYALPRLTAIAHQTALFIFSVGLALVLFSSDLDPMRTLRESSAAGIFARRALPVLVLLPLVMGYIRLKGERAGLYDTPMGVALLVLSLTALMCGIVWSAVRAVRVHERALEKSRQALREADRRKDEFLATLAHELRTPLAPVRNSLELLKHAKERPGVADRALAMMDRQMRTMVRLIDDLIDVSRITRGRLELHREPVELSTVVQLAVEAAQPLCERSHQELIVSVPPETVVLHADRVRLAQVLGNLLTNACKFTPEGGRIWLTARHRDGQVELAVKDDGIGLEPELLPRLFEMFSRGDRSRTRGQDGLGIGLSLVRSLVELHGGTISARSEGPGRGSEFVVKVPLPAGQPVEASPAGRVVDPSPAGRGMMPAIPPAASRILVVDDNRDSAESLALLLGQSGHPTTIAHDGAEAVRKAAAERPDVILLDLGMPVMDGYDACRAIRAEPWGRGMRIVALTGWGAEADRLKSRRAGFDAHLVKPVDHAALLEALDPAPRS